MRFLRRKAAKPDPDDERPFWKRKTMREMTREEWESLCDGCGRCCLNKLYEEGTNKLYYTDVGCRLLDTHSCRCKDYKNRAAKVDDCVTLSTRNINRIDWLPPTCAYKLVAAGISVRGKVSDTEVNVPDDKLDEYIVKWPMKWPKGSRG
jgi:hypothetical protein